MHLQEWQVWNPNCVPQDWQQDFDHSARFSEGNEVTKEHASSFAGSDLFGSLNLGEYWEIARRRKWWILLPGVALFCCVAIVALHLPNLYRAVTVILVDPQQVPSNYVAPTLTAPITDRLSTIQEQVLSPSRLSHLINTLGLYPELRGKVSDQDIVRRMQQSISVEIVNSGGSRQSAFRVAFQGKNPQEVADVANQLAAMFIQENLNARARASAGATDFIEAELAETKRKLEEKESELSAIRRKYVLDLPESKQFHLENLASLRNQLQANEDRVRSAQQQKVLLQSMSETVANAPTIDLDQFGNTPTAPYQVEIQKLETNLSALRARYGPNYPDVRKVEKQLSDLKAKAAEEARENPLQADNPPAYAIQRRRRNPVIDAQVSRLDQDIAEQTKLQAGLQERVNFHMAKLEQVPVFEQKIGSLMRDYDSLRHHYSSLEDKRLSAGMAEALETRQKGERFIVLDPAVIPEKPFGPNRVLISLAALVGGLAGGLALAVIVEIGDESVRSETEAVRILGKPVLAGIPFIVTPKQQWRDRFIVVVRLVGTVACSSALGFLISRFAGSWF